MHQRQEEGGKLTSGEREEVTGIGLGEGAGRDHRRRQHIFLQFIFGFIQIGSWEGSEEQNTKYGLDFFLNI